MSHISLRCGNFSFFSVRRHRHNPLQAEVMEMIHEREVCSNSNGPRVGVEVPYKRSFFSPCRDPNCDYPTVQRFNLRVILTESSPLCVAYLLEICDEIVKNIYYFPLQPLNFRISGDRKLRKQNNFGYKHRKIRR